MSPLEILRAYRMTMEEMKSIERQIEMLRIPDGPKPLRPIGNQPKGTNDPVSAAMQALDGLEETLAQKARQLHEIAQRGEDVLRSVPGQREKTILRMYHVLGMTDMEIGLEVGLSRARVNALRIQAEKSLS